MKEPAAITHSGEQLHIELWVSLASLLRSYTAAYGLNGNRQATVELGAERITVWHGNGRLELDRQGATIHWRREDGRGGVLELTEAGRLRDPRSENPDLGHPDEEEMDMTAEAWARELMHEE